MIIYSPFFKIQFLYLGSISLQGLRQFLPENLVVFLLITTFCWLQGAAIESQALEVYTKS